MTSIAPLEIQDSGFRAAVKFFPASGTASSRAGTVKLVKKKQNKKKKKR